MVIILQQTTDNGKRFVSTVVEEESSFNSNFSLGSQNSISERSAIYKQRIDSLFGRHSRLNPFRPNIEPFCIRIDGSSFPSVVSSVPTAASSIQPAQYQIPRVKKNGAESGPSIGVEISEEIEHVLSSDDDEDYQVITEKNSSIVTDSLNTGNVNSGSKIILNHNSPGSPHNVSSVQITCDDSDTGPHAPIETAVRICSEEQGNLIPEESLMWRNGSYGESPCSEDKPYGLMGSRNSPGGTLRFPVEYLGSIPVAGTTTALQDLQAPLRTLYLNFLTRKNVMSGQLAITSDGLRFEAPKLRLVNPFTTIAVWAAIKFVARGDPVPTDCAFMPLISDPEGQDKGRLFSRMETDLARVYCTQVNSSINKGQFRNPPIFACVMREATFSLDCHAFACKCAEDAIVVAANLYQSLVDKMRATSKEGESGYGSLSRGSPATHSSPNQMRSSSSASSIGSPNECSGNASSGSGSRSSGIEEGCSPTAKREHRVVFSDSESVPIRPPRRKKKSSEVPSGNLKRYNSDDSVLLKIPTRRKSFKSNYLAQQHIKPKKRVQIASPEDASTESVNESIDQILDRVINPGGMSFNDLKPSYQELILKIALTLTQDQLYQKSKQAMKKHQQFNFRKKSKSSSGETSDDSSQFLNQLMKSFSKMKSNRANHSSKPSVASKSSIASSVAPKVILKKTKEEEPFMSFCSGCICEKCSEKCYCSLPPKSNGKIVGLPSTSTPCSTTVTNSPNQHLKSDTLKKGCGYDTDSCAESEKCYCSLQRVKSNGIKIYNINLDTETSDTDTNSYDFEPFNQTETTSSSNLKTVSTRSVEILSYQPANSKRVTYNLSPPTQSHLQTTNATVHFEDDPPTTTTIQTSTAKQSSGSRYHLNISSPYLHQSDSKQTSGDERHDSPNLLQRNKVMLITGASSSARVVYKDSNSYQSRLAEFGDGKRARSEQHRNLVDIVEDEGNEEELEEGMSNDDEDVLGPENVLSMKKTAEIAAMFTDLRLDQTTNVVPDLTSDNYDSANNTEDSNQSVDFEASLGYLP